MSWYILRRLGQAVVTIFGVMIITFMLFRVIAGDIAGAWLGQRATLAEKADWLHLHGYDKPLVLNVHRQLVIEDKSQGKGAFSAAGVRGSGAPGALGLVLSVDRDEQDNPVSQKLTGRYVLMLDETTPTDKLTQGRPISAPEEAAQPDEAREELPKADPAPPAEAQTQPATVLATQPATAPATQPAAMTADDAATTQPVDPLPCVAFTASDGTKIEVNLSGADTAGEIIARINTAGQGKIVAYISQRTPSQVFDSQFFHHLWNSITFQGVSLQDQKTTLQETIRQRAPASLAITVPAMALGWVLALSISSVVAYYRGTWIDRIGVLLSVLGMCIPFLAWMMYGQMLVFHISSRHAYGIANPANVYVPIAIMVLAGIGGNVRFYRTVILDETKRDYVRTARAKGVPLPTVLSRHILKNCMLPILTSLIMAIPFLILGNLLVEQYFGIPGLGDLMITSISSRNEPIFNGLVFLTALIYVVGVLVTDVCYALFDPRIRLR